MMAMIGGSWLLLLVGVLALLGPPVFASDGDDGGCPEVCPKCPSAKTIAEQVVENIDAKPRPTVVTCRKGHVSRAGFVARCLVLFPTAGTPPLARGGAE